MACWRKKCKSQLGECCWHGARARDALPAGLRDLPSLSTALEAVVETDS